MCRRDFLIIKSLNGDYPEICHFFLRDGSIFAQLALLVLPRSNGQFLSINCSLLIPGTRRHGINHRHRKVLPCEKTRFVEWKIITKMSRTKRSSECEDRLKDRGVKLAIAHQVRTRIDPRARLHPTSLSRHKFNIYTGYEEW